MLNGVDIDFGGLRREQEGEKDLGHPSCLYCMN